MPKLSSVLLVVLFLSGCGSSNPLLSTKDGRSLDAYLREKLDDPSYEVVRFWPPVESHSAHELLKSERESSQAILESSESIAGDEAGSFSDVQNMVRRAKDGFAADDKLYRECSNGSTVRACRLKFRARSKEGGLELRDRVFFFSRKGAVVRGSLPDEADLLFRDFPE